MTAVDIDRLFETMCKVSSGEVTPEKVYRQKLENLINRVNQAMTRILNTQNNAQATIGEFVDDLAAEGGFKDEDAALSKIDRSLKKLDSYRQELENAVQLGSDQLELQRSKIKDLMAHLELLRNIASRPKPGDQRIKRMGQATESQFKQSIRNDNWGKR